MCGIHNVSHYFLCSFVCFAIMLSRDGFPHAKAAHLNVDNIDPCACTTFYVGILSDRILADGAAINTVAVKIGDFFFLSSEICRP